MPIVKILTHKKPKFEYLLRYMLEDKDRLFDAQGKSFVLTHNIRGKSLDGWVKQFQENETHRLRKRKNSVYLNHEIISFHRDDSKHLSMEKLDYLVRKYIQLRNPNGCYVACAHMDKYHMHVHIASSAVQFRTGKSMRMSRKELADLKKDFQRYQMEKFPELARSVVRHGRQSNGKLSEKEQQYSSRLRRMSKRESVRRLVQACSIKSTSDEDFYANLKLEGFETYIRGGKLYGVIHEGRRYRFSRMIEHTEKHRAKKVRQQVIRGR